MLIEIDDKFLKGLNPQSIERTAERLVYNSSDVLKVIVHNEVHQKTPPESFFRENVDLIRAGVYRNTSHLQPGYNAEAKLALSHIIISTLVLIKQLDIDQKELSDLIIAGINDHHSEW